MPTKSPRKESRRRPRTNAKWPVVVELDDRVLEGETVDVSQIGVKVRLGVRLDDYKLVTLRLNPPEGCPVEAQAIVLRTDNDGTAFRLLKKNLSALLPDSDKDAAAPRLFTVLAVDDDPAVGALVRDILGSTDYFVLFTQDPHKALRLAKQHPGDIDLLLADVVMPLMDGRELARRVLELRPTIKVLLMSGFEMTSLRNTGWPVLAKPFGITELVEKIGECTTAAKQPSVFTAPKRSARPPAH
jgi:CheY-like chemotaxis protein